MFWLIIFVAILLIILFLIFRRKEFFDITDTNFESLKNTIMINFNNFNENQNSGNINSILSNLEISKKEMLANRLKKFKELTVNLLDDKSAEKIYFELRMNDDMNIKKQLAKASLIYKTMANIDSDYNILLLNMLVDYAKNTKFTKTKPEYTV
jgi:hypothetical protein